jgi:hypothetical protein
MGRKEKGIPELLELLFNCLTYSEKTNHMLSSSYHSPHNICFTQAIVHSLIKPILVMKQFFHTSWKFKATAANTLGLEVLTNTTA